jgi:hypothetical protein
MADPSYNPLQFTASPQLSGATSDPAAARPGDDPSAAQPAAAYNPLDYTANPYNRARDAVTPAPPPPPPQKDLLDTPWLRLPSNDGGDGSVWDAMATGTGAEGNAFSAPVLSDIAAKVRGFVTGDTSVRDPSIPPLSLPDLGVSPTSAAGLKILGQMAVSRDPVALGQVIKNNVPGATVDWDDPDPKAANRQLVVTMPDGKQMYVDRPGLTPQKLAFYGPQTGIALATQGRSLAGQMIPAGLQQAGSQLASYLLGGAEAPVDLVGTAEAAAAPAVLRGAGAAVAKGVDWLTSEASTTAQAIADRARGLYRWGFGAKEGDLTGDPSQLGLEDRLANAGSTDAQRTMMNFHNANADTNQQNKLNIVGAMSNDHPDALVTGGTGSTGGTPVPDTYAPSEGQFGDKLNDAVRAKVDALQQNERNAWGKFGDLSPDTPAGRSLVFDPSVSADLQAGVTDIMRRRLGFPDGPNGTYSPAQVQAAGNEIQLSRQLQRVALGPDPANPQLQSFNLGDYDQVRQNINAALRKDPSNPALVQMKNLFDKATTDGVNNGSFTGSPTALQQYRDAVQATRDKYAFTTPDNNPAASTYISKTANPGYSGQEGMTDIMGGGNVVTPGGGTSNIITHLQSNMGADATDPLAGALGVRMGFGTRGTSELGTLAPPRFNYNTTAANIRQQADPNNGVGQLLITPEMRSHLLDYADALSTLGSANRTGMRLNPSGSGYLSLVAGKMPLGLGPVFEKFQSGAAARNAIGSGGDIVSAANQGRNTAAGLNIKLPTQRAPMLTNPSNPSWDWQRSFMRSIAPAARVGGLLGDVDAAPPSRTSLQ